MSRTDDSIRGIGTFTALKNHLLCEGWDLLLPSDVEGKKVKLYITTMYVNNRLFHFDSDEIIPFTLERSIKAFRIEDNWLKITLDKKIEGSLEGGYEIV